MPVNGNPIAADTLFLEKRRRGLARFINAVIRHPVLNQEQLVIMFLTVPTVSFLVMFPDTSANLNPCPRSCLFLANRQI